MIPINQASVADRADYDAFLAFGQVDTQSVHLDLARLEQKRAENMFTQKTISGCLVHSCWISSVNVVSIASAAFPGIVTYIVLWVMMPLDPA